VDEEPAGAGEEVDPPTVGGVEDEEAGGGAAAPELELPTSVVPPTTELEEQVVLPADWIVKVPDSAVTPVES